MKRDGRVLATDLYIELDNSFLVHSSKHFEARSSILLLPVQCSLRVWEYNRKTIKKDVKYKQIKSKIVN